MPFNEQKLTLDPNDKDKALNYAERSERLRELVAKRKAAGLSAHDPRYVVDLLKEVEGMAVELAPDKNELCEKDLELPGYKLNKVKSSDVHLIGDQVLFTLPRQDKQGMDVCRLSGEMINKEPLPDFPIETFKLNGQLGVKFDVFHASDENPSRFVNLNGEEILFKGEASDYKRYELMTDDDGNLCALLEQTVNGDAQLTARAINLNKEPITEWLTDYTFVMEKDNTLTWSGQYKKGKDEAGYNVLGRGEKQNVRGENVSIPFKYGKSGEHFCIQVENSKVSIENFGNINFTYFNFHVSEVAVPSNVIVNGKDVCFTIKTKGWRNSSQNGVLLFHFDGTHIEILNEKNRKIPRNSDFVDFRMVNGQVVYTGYLPGKGFFYYLHNLGKVKLGSPTDKPCGEIFAFEDERTVMGHTGKVFFLTVDGEKITLWVDGEPQDFPAGEITYSASVNDHMFWAHKIPKAENKKLNPGKHRVSSLWIDGQPTQYQSNDILKVVFVNDKYYFIGKEKNKGYAKIIVREIKI